MTPPSSPLSEGQQSSNLEAPVPAGQGGLATESRPTLKPCSQAPRRFRISAEHGEAIQNLQESFGKVPKRQLDIGIIEAARQD